MTVRILITTMQGQKIQED